MSDTNTNTVSRLMAAPYGHWIRLDRAGNSHVTLYDDKGTEMHTIVAPTFDEAVTRALDIADRLHADQPVTLEPDWRDDPKHDAKVEARDAFYSRVLDV